MQSVPKKKILFVLQDMRTGGAEKIRFIVEKHIDKNVYETVYCCIREVGAIGEEIVKNGGKVICLKTDDRFFNFFATFKLYRAVRSIRPDIIHSVLFNANFHARMVGIFAGKPVITEEQGIYVWKKWYHIIIDRVLARFTRRIIAASNTVKNFLISQEGLEKCKIVVIYNCVDPDSLRLNTTRQDERSRLSVSDKDFIIGAVGNLRKEKAHGTLLDAFKKVAQRCDDTRLFIAGSGPLKDSLCEKARRLDIDKEVVFLGKVNPVAGFLKAIDLFVMPSASEGMPLALLEAIVMQVPCITSDAGGIKEVADKVKGIKMVAVNNHDELANAIICEIEKRRNGAYEPMPLQPGGIDLFMPKAYVNRLENIYKEVSA